MLRKINFIVILIIIFCPKPKAQNHFIDSIKENYKIVGLTYAVFSSDTIWEKGALGIRNIINDTSFVKITNRFHIGSNTKAVTAILAAKLVEENMITWETKFFDLFPEMQDKANQEYLQITLKDLLCHKAHIQPHLEVNSEYDIYKIPGTSTEQRIDFCKIILNEKPVYPDTGKTYVYSNAGIVMAAAMVERSSGNSWEKLIDDLDNELNFNFQIGFPNQSDLNETWGHILTNESIAPLFPDDYKIAAVMRPAGDLNIDILSYIKFIQLIMDGYRGHDNFLKSETYKYLLSSGIDYSFGWANKMINGRYYNYHSGSAGTYGCFVKIDRDNNLAAIIMENYCDGGALNAIQLIAEYLLNKYDKK